MGAELEKKEIYKPFQNLPLVILNAVKDLNLLKLQDSSLRSE